MDVIDIQYKIKQRILQHHSCMQHVALLCLVLSDLNVLCLLICTKTVLY